MRLRFLPAVWIGLILFAPTARADAQPKDLTGTIRNVKFYLPAITFNFLDDQSAMWDCKGGTPDDMEAGGWFENSMRGAGTLKIQPVVIRQDQISIKSVKTANGRILLPKPPIKRPAPAVVCTREATPAK